MKIGIIIDFVCPYCFVGTEIMWKVLGEDWRNSDIVWFPYELAPEPTEQKRSSPDREKYFEENILPWAVKEGIKVNFPGIDPIPRTSLAFQGIKIAEKHNLTSQFVKAVFESYWIHNKDIGSVDVLSEIGGNLGIPKDEFQSSLQRGEFKEEHKKQNDEISEWDFEVVPTFYIDGEKIPDFPRTYIEMNKILKKL
ncbi:MAG: DsbA family oxidoreductase [Fusobacteriaceae bacterium]